MHVSLLYQTRSLEDHLQLQEAANHQHRYRMDVLNQERIMSYKEQGVRSGNIGTFSCAICITNFRTPCFQGVAVQICLQGNEGIVYWQCIYHVWRVCPWWGRPLPIATVHSLCKDYSHELRFQLWIWKLLFNTPIAKVILHTFISPSTVFGIIWMFVNISHLVYPNSNCHLINDKLSGLNFGDIFREYT